LRQAPEWSAPRGLAASLLPQGSLPALIKHVIDPAIKGWSYAA